MKKSLLITALLLVVMLCIAGALDYNRVFKEWNGAPVSQLRSKGDAFLFEDQVDSALLFYTMAAGKYRTNLPDTVKNECAGALNNAGYIYFFFKNDYSSSYTCLLRALEIAETTGNKRILPCLYLNMGNIYINYHDYDTSVSYYRKAFLSGIEAKDWRNMLTAFSNMVNEALQNKRPQDVQDDIRRFRKLNLPKIPMLSYTNAICDAADMFQKGNKTGAIAALKKAKTLIDTDLTPERYSFGIDMLVAMTYADMGQYQEAVKLMEQVEQATDGIALDLRAEACDLLSQYCGQQGQSEQAVTWRGKSLQLSDSLFRSQQYSQIRDMRSAYEIKKMDSRIQQVENERHTMKVALCVVAVAALIVLGLVVLLLRKNRSLRLSNRHLFRRNEEVVRLSENERRMREVYEQRMAEQEHELAALHERKEQPARKETKYQGSSLDDLAKQRLVNRICQVMDNVDEIAVNDFSVERLARLVESNTKYVSQVINEEYGKNFSTLLGETRVRLACLRLCDTEHYGHLTIEAIAMGLGFKSRSNFVSVFKRVTGLTPSDYKKIGQTGESVNN